jgi:hypothetical protein
MENTTSLTPPIPIGNVSELRQAMISASNRDAGGRTEAIKAILTAAVDAETKLHAAGLTPCQLPGARNVTVYSLREPSDDTQAIHSLAITAERMSDGWYVVDIRRNIFWRSEPTVVITPAQQEIITKVAAEKALAGFRVHPMVPMNQVVNLHPERVTVTPPPLDIAARQTPPPFLRPKPKPVVTPESKPEIVSEDVVRETKPGAPDEQVKGYYRSNGTFVAAHKRGPKKHRKSVRKEKVAA